MTVTFPEFVRQDGATSVTLVQTIAALAAPKLATEINGASSVNVSCYVFDGAVGTVTQNKGDAPKRLCTRSVFQQFGNKSYDVTDLQYGYNPQLPGTDVANKAKTALLEGTKWFMVVRRGLAGDTAIAVADVVDIWHIELGPQNRTATGTGEFDVFTITQAARVIDTPTYDAVVAT